MKIIVDADACPVVNISIDLAQKYELEIILVCDHNHYMEKEGAKTITVAQGNDSADFTIVNLLNKSDIVITEDYGLAAMCLAKAANILKSDGIIYNDNNIAGMLEQRHISKKTRMATGRFKGPSKRKKESNVNFKMALEKLILKLI